VCRQARSVQGAFYERTRGNGHKLKQRKLQLNPRKNFFPLRVTEPWPRLPREAVDGPRWYPRSLPMGFRQGFLLRALLLIAALLCCLADRDQMSRGRFL